MSTSRTAAAVDERACPACGTRTSRPLGSRSGFALGRCTACHSIHVTSAGSTLQTQDYDEEYYGPHHCAVPPATAARIRDICTEFAPYRRGNRILDVGFGTGAFLRAAAADGWVVAGVEVSRSCVEQARAHGFDVFPGELEDARFPDRHFDVVLAVEVIEHVIAPRRLADEIARVLRPGGLFWATTPHARGLSARLLGLRWSVVSPPEHLQLFTVDGVRSLLTAAGFTRIQTRTHGVNVLELAHAVRSRTEGWHGVDRAQSSRRINEFLMAGAAGRALKRAANRTLDALRLGDTIKIRATT